MIDFPGHLSTGIGHAIMEHRERSVIYRQDTIKQQDAFMVFSKRRLDSLYVFRHSVENPHSTCTTQLVISIVFESSYFIGSSEQYIEK